MRRYDVIIVGAGPAGSTLAIPLARSGLDVLILDKDHFPRDKPCGDFVSPVALRTLRDLGTLAKIEQHNFSVVRRSRVYIEDELAFRSYAPPEESAWGYGYIIPRLDLDQTLSEAALTAGAEGYDGCRVDGFALEPGGVRVSAMRDGREQLFHTRLVVGADGANSAIAESAGLAMNDTRYMMVSQRAYARGLDLQGENVIWFGEPYFPGCGWFFPLHDGRVNIGVALMSEVVRKHHIRLPEFMQAMTALAAEWARVQGGQLEMGRVGGWVLKTYGGLARTYFEHGLLVGDAGSFIDPVSGQGIAVAMETGQLAAQTIRDAFQAGDFSQRFLARYQARWKARLDINLRLSDLIVSTIRNRYLAHLWLDSLRIICDTARRYPDCARRFLGIFTGAPGARDGFALDIILKSLFHSPRFWLDLLGLNTHMTSTDVLAQLHQRTDRDLSVMAALVADAHWVTDWGKELQVKLLDVLDALSAQASAPVRWTH